LYRDVRSELLEEEEANAEDRPLVGPLLPEAANAGASDGEGSDDEFNDLDEEELSGFVLSAPEAAKKGAIWSEMNKQFLEERESKAKRAAEDAKNNKDGDGGVDKKKAKKKRPLQRGHAMASAEEALDQTLVARKISKKINYEALNSIFGPAGEVSAEYQQPGAKRRRAMFTTGASSTASSSSSSSSSASSLASSTSLSSSSSSSGSLAPPPMPPPPPAPGPTMRVPVPVPVPVVPGTNKAAMGEADDRVEDEYDEEEEFEEEHHYTARQDEEDEYQDEVDW